MKYFTAFILLVLFFSCKKEEKIVQEKVVPKIETKTEIKKDTLTAKEIKLEVFGFPQEVQGCSCYFATDREEFVKQNYIYVDDFQQNAFIKINGEQIKLEFDRKNEVLPEKKLNINLHNDQFKVNLKGKAVEEGEIETHLYKGKLTVENKAGKKTVIPVYGECGC